MSRTNRERSIGTPKIQSSLIAKNYRFEPRNPFLFDVGRSIDSKQLKAVKPKVFGPKLFMRDGETASPLCTPTHDTDFDGVEIFDPLSPSQDLLSRRGFGSRPVKPLTLVDMPSSRSKNQTARGCSREPLSAARLSGLVLPESNEELLNQFNLSQQLKGSIGARHKSRTFSVNV